MFHIYNITIINQNHTNYTRYGYTRIYVLIFKTSGLKVYTTMTQNATDVGCRKTTKTAAADGKHRFDSDGSGILKHPNSGKIVLRMADQHTYFIPHPTTGRGDGAFVRGIKTPRNSLFRQNVRAAVTTL